MLRLPIIAVIAASYVGCASGLKPPESPPRPRPVQAYDRPVRITVTPSERVRLERLLVGRPLLGGRDAILDLAPATAAGCHVLPVRPGRVAGDGGSLDLEAILRRLDRPGDAAAAWLRGPVRSLAVAGPGQVEVCLSRRVPDLGYRFAFDRLWVADFSEWDGALEGPGDYRRDGGPFVPAPWADRSLPRLLLVVGDSEQLLRLGDADLGLVYGEASQRLEEFGGFRLARAPAKDVEYQLWFDRSRRWVNDPRFRRWLAAALDRESLARDLFGDRASPSLLPSTRSYEPPSAPKRRPLGPGSVPRLTVGHASGDATAEWIARRLEAEWKGVGLDVTRAASEVGADVVIVGRESWTGDALLDWGVSLAPLDFAKPVLRQLEQASRWPEGGRRQASLAAVEDPLVESAELVPLVRIEAWVATRSGSLVSAADRKDTLGRLLWNR